MPVQIRDVFGLFIAGHVGAAKKPTLGAPFLGKIVKLTSEYRPISLK
jgi:hypothetical protein